MTIDEFKQITGQGGTTSPKPIKNAAPALSASQYILNAMTMAKNQVTDAAHGAAQGAIRGGLEAAELPAQVGSGIEKALTKVIPGTKDFNTGDGGKSLEAAAENPGLLPKNEGEKKGQIVGQAADVLAMGPRAIAEDVLKTGDVIGGAVKKISPIAAKVAEFVRGPAVDPLEEALSPRLTAKVAEKEGGENPAGVVGKINRTVTDATKRLVTAVKNVGIDLTKFKTWTEKANVVGDANKSEAQYLTKMVEDHNHPYTFRELRSWLGKIGEPELIKSGDATVRGLYERARTKMLSLARDNGGDVSGLLQARKDFYSWANKEYKNLWGSETITTAREGIGAIANTVNGFIADAVDAAEPGAGKDFRDSLRTQSDLFDAEDILNEKAARGAPAKQGEIGTNKVERFADTHPKTIKAVGAAATAAGAGIVGGETIKHL